MLTVTENLINAYVAATVVVGILDMHEQSFILTRLTWEQRCVERLPWALVASL